MAKRRQTTRKKESKEKRLIEQAHEPLQSIHTPSEGLLLIGLGAGIILAGILIGKSTLKDVRETLNKLMY